MRLLLLFSVALTLASQQPPLAPFNPVVPDSVPATAPDDEPEAYPGQHNHAEPPDGYQCHRPPMDFSGDPATWCKCERYCDEETQVPKADKDCKSYCWEKKACTCPQGDMKRCMPAEPPH